MKVFLKAIRLQYKVIGDTVSHDRLIYNNDEPDETVTNYTITPELYNKQSFPDTVTTYITRFEFRIVSDEPKAALSAKFAGQQPISNSDFPATATVYSYASGTLYVVKNMGFKQDPGFPPLETGDKSGDMTLTVTGTLESAVATIHWDGFARMYDGYIHD